ncbi:MAG: glycosyltransferase family 32 protein [Aestuariivirga sp.]|uniref:glycosyltransferase family 32 protein n=1 Tax=Aestuariivirga sp. TaxID=2650926 RepID=UPI0038D1DC8E
MPIPKHIFQTARSYESLPADFRDNIASLRERNPDWTYRFFGDDEMKDFIRQHVSAGDWHEIQNVNPKYGVVLADLFRYLVIYHEGGVYLDIKSTARRPLSEAIDLNASFILSQWPNKIGERYQGYGLHPELRHVPGGEFQQWNIIAEPRHAFLKAAVKQVLHNIKTYTPGQFGTDAYGVLRVSGPIAYTQAIYPLLDHYPFTATDVGNHGIRYSLYEDGGNPQRHQDKLPGHYAAVKEPVVIRDVYVEPEAPVITRLGELLAREVRDNIDLVLKLAVFSFVAAASFVALFLAVAGYLAFTR